MLTIHIFLDNGGLFSRKAIEFIEAQEPQKHIYYFIGKKEINIPDVNLIHTESDFLAEIAKGKIGKVIFHSLHYYQLRFIETIRKVHPSEVIIGWMFWSFEYYQLPFHISNLYDRFSSGFLLRKKLFLIAQNLYYFLKRKVDSPFLISEKKYRKQIGNVDQFFSFVEDDYLAVYPSGSKTEYHFLPYLNITDIQVNQSVPSSDFKIMIGHNGSPNLNHYEIVEFLKNHPSYSNSEILIPMSYGKKAYIKKLKAKIQSEAITHVSFIEHSLPMKEYYGMLASISVFFLNSFCQQGLGNVIFFLLNGTTVYLSEKTSTYQFFIKKGFIVFAIESLQQTQEIRLLNEEEKHINKQKLEEFLSVENVKKAWKNMLNC